MPQDDDLLVCQSCGAKFVKKAQTSQPEHSASDARQNEEVQKLKSRIADMEQKQAAMEVELAKAKKASQTNGALGASKSGFTATVFELFAERLLLMWVSMVTLGFAYPWLKCHYEGFIASKTYVKGRRLSFDGKGKDLAKKYYLWMLLCVVTFGIYSIFLADKLHKWVIEHTHYDGNEGGESSYDGKTGVIFGFKLASFFAGAFTLGLAKPFVECKREGYLCEHAIIDDSHLYFDGTGSGLLKKQVLWIALTIATCGVYAIWLNLQKEQWICANKSNDSVDLDESVATVLTPEERARIAEEKRLQHEQERAQRALERQQQKERLKEMKKTPQGKLSTALFAVAVVFFAVALALMIVMLVEGSCAWFEPSSKALIAFEVIFSVATAAMMAGCIVCSKKIQRTALAIAAIVLIVCSVGTMSAGFYGSSQAVKYSNVDPFFYKLLDDGTYMVSFRSNLDYGSDGDYQMYFAKVYAIEKLKGDIVIPSNYNGVPVTTIGCLNRHGVGSDFSPDDITGVTIPDSITTISGWAFEGLSGITEITIPASVEVVGENAFMDCTNLTTVYWNTSAEIKNNNGIFSGCTKLTNIIVGENVTRVPQTVYNEEWFNNQPDGLVIANNYVYGYKGTIPFNYSLILPNGTLGIMDNAFLDSGSAITSVTIPDSVTYVGKNAFSGCTGIETFSAPASIASKVAKESDSQNLGKIIITSGSTIEPDAFYGCTGLTSVTIGNSVTSIGNSAFYDCTGLTSITIPDSVTSIGNYAFRGCTGLTSVTIGNSVTSIGEYAFRNCTGLTSITIPDSVTSIGNYAFRGCTGLTSVTIGNSVTSIGNYAFYGCTGLTSVTIGNSVTSIGYEAFDYCANLEEVHVESLEDWCAIDFGDYGYTLRFNSAKLYIDGEVPSGNYVIPDGITIIPAYTFRNCTGLTSVTIPDGVTSIGYEAFRGCTGLTSITIPDSVTSIESDAFEDCRSLQTVYYGGTQSQWNNISIGSNNSYLTSATRIVGSDGTTRTYTFVTNCDETIPSQTVTYLASLPTISRTGYTFVGWYDNSSLTGSPVTAPYASKDNTTLYAKWTVVVTGSSFDSAISAIRGSSYTVNITTGGQIVYFVFRPTTSRTYTIQSTGSGDTYATLYNSSKSSITSNDDGGNGNNFLISYSMTAGETYYIAVRYYSSSTTGSFTVQFS